MALAKDDGARSAPRNVDRDIIAAAAAPATSRGVAGIDVKSHNPVPRTMTSKEVTSRGTAGINVASHNPVPSVMFAPNRDALLERAQAELAMRAGALTTVPEVEAETTGVPAWDAALAAHARRGQGVPEETVTPSAGPGGRAGDPRALRMAWERRRADAGTAAMAAFEAGVRATRKGMREGGRTDKIKEMTAEAFEKLNPRQQAAVELNSMLTAAIEADRSSADGARSSDYKDTVEELFATGAADHAPYAPNTVELLSNLGWEGAPATKLEDILSGKALFTRQDIADLARPENSGGTDARLNTSMALRDQIQSSLVDAFSLQRQEPIAGENLLAAKQDLLAYQDLPGFSTKPSREVSPGVDLNTFIRSGYDLLSRADAPYTQDEILADAKSNLSDTEFQAFLNFIDINSRDAENFRQPLGSNPEQSYFDPVEFRRAIAADLRKARGDASSR